MSENCYIAIDLKSFYASVECVDRGLNPMTANLVVADESRTDKTICLAVTPTLKALGIPGRPRLFEVRQKIAALRKQSRYRQLEYIVAPPRMARYMEVSAQIYSIYLKYIAAEDIHVYSIDEVFIDATQYLSLYKLPAKELAMKIIKDILATTGITATAGIGTNLYLCKVAMDIVAKHIQADENGVRIAELDEISYRRELWDHRPITDFWRVGRGTASRLEQYGIYTMGDIARRSHTNENFLYKLFGINAELLIDHAWGWEPCTMKHIKAYRPQSHSLSSGQVLHCPYPAAQAKTVVKEMTEMLSLDMVEKGVVCDQIVLGIGYDMENVTKGFEGETVTDYYGRQVPKHAHGSENLGRYTSSTRLMEDCVCRLFDRIADPSMLIRRINVCANHVIYEKEIPGSNGSPELDLFSDVESEEKRFEEAEKSLEKERKIQETIISLHRKYGRNSVLKGMNFEEGATAKDRNKQIGGHKA
ncbi:MAG: DNA methylase [Candidatus Cryptobacteroides sp.]